MTDDQGYGDIAAHGNPIIKTPNLDRLHAESARFTDFHVNSFCAPTRAALMTGRLSDRTHVRTTINLRNHLHIDETTMAEYFKASGYQTALFGKWHLGGNYPYRPIDKGFDQWVGHGDGGVGTSSDYWGNDRMNDHYQRNGEWEPFKGFSSDIFFKETMNFVKQNKDKPFFVYLATNVPHDPWNVLKEWRKIYDDEDRLNEDEKDFYATITHFDENLGQLRKFLKQQGLDENTILLFMTDNGTAKGERIYNAEMKGKKGSQYEGGHRVPLFVHWPKGKLNKGRDVNGFALHVDILPTLIELCDLEKPKTANLPFDGESLSGFLYDKPVNENNKTLILHSQNVREVPQKGLNSLVATSQWRWIKGKELYDIKKDPSQENNVANLYPEVVKALTKKYNEYWDEVKPGYVPYPRVVIGHKDDREVWLTPDAMVHDHARQKTAMQSYVLQKKISAGFWPIEVEKKGTYTFEVTRWPKELNHPMIERLPAVTSGDILDKGKPVMMPEGEAIPIVKVRLRAGDTEKEVEIKKTDTKAVFTLPLEKGPNLVRAWFISEDNKEMGATYIYISRD
ncbi:arylsulfatase [Flavivirga amylovorans]